MTLIVSHVDTLQSESVCRLGTFIQSEIANCNVFVIVGLINVLLFCKYSDYAKVGVTTGFMLTEYNIWHP